MRPIISILLAVGLLAGIYCYTNFANSVRPTAIEYKASYASGKYSVRLSRTFDCVANVDFGFDTALEVRFKEEKILHRSDKVLRSEPILIDLPTVELGRNAVYVEANLPSALSADFSGGFDSMGSQSHAMRVEVLKDKTVIAESSFWISSGLDSVTGTIYFSVDSEEEEKQHDHDH